MITIYNVWYIIYNIYICIYRYINDQNMIYCDIFLENEKIGFYFNFYSNFIHLYFDGWKEKNIDFFWLITRDKRIDFRMVFTTKRFQWRSIQKLSRKRVGNPLVFFLWIFSLISIDSTFILLNLEWYLRLSFLWYQSDNEIVINWLIFSAVLCGYYLLISVILNGYRINKNSTRFQHCTK